jgi:poly-gamma-glutamate capsule biosynthesis protein CapA/YwtB (metallophosphatase superfamily)
VDFNVCTLANNHTLDWGIDALVECREQMKAMDIAMCEAGLNILKARSRDRGRAGVTMKNKGSG